MTIELIAEILFGLAILVWIWLAFYGPYSEKARREYMERQIAFCDAITETRSRREKKN